MSGLRKNKPERGRAPDQSPPPPESAALAALAEKPFRLAKYFSTIAIVIIFAATLTLAGLISRQAEVIITNRVEDDTIMLMENLNHQMFTRFLVPTALDKGEIRLRDPQQYDLLNSVIMNTIHGFDVSRVVIYGMEGQVVYSTDPELLGEMVGDMQSYLEALRLQKMPQVMASPEDNRAADEDPDTVETEKFINRVRQQTVHRREGDGYILGRFFPKGKYILRSYKAMADYSTRGGISGVLEISRDLSPEFRKIARTQWLGLGVAVCVSLFLTLALRLVVGRGEAIINQKNQERQALMEQLGQSERLAGLGSMVATVAHEIRNPLGIIHSTADLLNSFLESRPEQARLASAIVEEADRLSEVVTEFLDFARPQTPKLEMVVVEDILEELLAFLEVTLTRAGVETRLAFRNERTPSPGDPGMLHRAFLNILINAIQAMPEGGLLTLESSVETDEEAVPHLAVTIADTGPGLSPEVEGKLFSPFHTTKAKGSGLGLVIVRNIVQSHGGSIRLISRPSPELGDPAGQETGLTVIVKLPI